jgi:nucleoside-diphosphate-sugar epimerase
MADPGTAKRKVVVTGACGYIASLMLPQLRELYELVLLDVVQPRDARPSSAVTNDATAGLVVHIADLSDTNLDAYRHHFTGADAVIHLGFGGAMGTQAA